MSKSNPEFQKPPANRKAWDEYWDRIESDKNKNYPDECENCHNRIGNRPCAAFRDRINECPRINNKKEKK